MKRRNVTFTRLVRGPEAAGDPDDAASTSGERMAAVWGLIRATLAWTHAGEPRLQRSVCRVERSRRCVEPVRIDIITAVDGLTFEPAWRNRVTSEYGGEPVFALSREDLIRNKRASGWPQDLADIDALERRR